jgi:hypothetical protein
LEPHHEARVATNHRCTCCLGLGGLLQLGVGSCGEVGSYQMNQLLQIVFLWIWKKQITENGWMVTGWYICIYIYRYIIWLYIYISVYIYIFLYIYMYMYMYIYNIYICICT